MAWCKEKFELINLSVEEWVELAGVTPSSISSLVLGGALPSFDGKTITIKEAVSAAVMGAFESSGVPLKLAGPAVRIVLYFLGEMGPRGLGVASTRARRSVQPDKQLRTFLAALTPYDWVTPVRRYAVVDRNLCLRLGGERLVREVAHRDQCVVFDLAQIANEIASRVKRPLLARESKRLSCPKSEIIIE